MGEVAENTKNFFKSKKRFPCVSIEIFLLRKAKVISGPRPENGLYLQGKRWVESQSRMDFSNTGYTTTRGIRRHPATISTSGEQNDLPIKGKKKAHLKR